MFFVSFSQFIRRLCIIILEDAVLHPAFPFVVWLMMTSTHGYTLTGESINILLKITWEIASIPYKDPLSSALFLYIFTLFIYLF